MDIRGFQRDLRDNDFSPNLLGPHSFVVRKERSLTEDKQGSGLRDPAAYKWLKSNGWYENGVFPPLNNWPDYWPRHSATNPFPEIWIERGWQMCRYCLKVQPVFTPELEPRHYSSAIRACMACVASFHYQNKSTLRQWLTEWYIRRGEEIRRGVDRIFLFATGDGEREDELDTYDRIVADPYILDLFMHRCAYCGNEAFCAMDHGFPRSAGGHSVAENMISCCFECNKLKAAKTVSQFYDYLARKKRDVPKDLRDLALRLEGDYIDLYGDLTKDEILRIKRPVMEALLPPVMGQQYRYCPVMSDRVSRTQHQPTSGEIVRVYVGHSAELNRNQSLCYVAQETDGRQGYVSRASLKPTGE